MQQLDTSLETLLSEAVDIPDLNERDAYLLHACGNDPSKLAAVQSMVRDFFAAGAILDRPSWFDPTLLTDSTPTDLEGCPEEPIDVSTRPEIGPYKLLEQIGEGGMGTVFMAVQSHPIKRKVALKIIKPGKDTGQVIARFEAERQALAMMNHPNIAKVLDAGTTSAGNPYFVMELIKGIPITEFCDQQEFDVHQRLVVFQQVCDAVQHAHQKGVIHRDLKPSNILVELEDVKAVVKVIDFGVAKATQQPLTERTLFTGFAQMIGTPLYMSPEQAQLNSLDVDVRSDVYSLGVLLYELLTGSTPFDRETLKRAGFDEMRRIIREDEPPRPSSRVSTLENQLASTVSQHRQTDRRHLMLTMKRELDWIVMRALEKDRTRRYESASAMSQDIQRYLDGDAVQACPPSTLYRSGKFIRRNKAWLTAAACFAFALMIGTGVATWQAIRAAAAEQVAISERENSEQNLEAAMDAIEQLLVHVANPVLANVPAVQSIRAKILQDSLDFYERFSQQSGRSDRVEYRAAKVFRELGVLAKGSQHMPQAADAYLKALNIADRLVRQSPRRIEYLELQAELNGRLCQFFMHPLSGDIARDKATAHTKLAEQQYNMLSQLVPGNEEYPRLRASRLIQLAAIYQKKDPADPRVAEIAEQARRLTNRPTALPGLMVLLASINEKGNPDLAETYYRQAIVEIRAESHDDHEIRNSHAWLCGAAANFFATRNVAETESLCKEAVEILIELTVGFPEYKEHRWALNIEVSRYIGLLDNSGRSAEVLPQINEWLERCPEFHTFRARRLAMNDADVAIKALTEAIDEYPGEHRYWTERGSLYLGQGANDQALADLNRGVELGGTKSHVPNRNRADYFISTKDYSKAIEDYDKCLEQGHQAYIYKRRAYCHFRLGDFDKCIADMKQSVKFNPTDFTNLTWIPVSEIAACPNDTFREAYLNLVDVAVEANGRSATVLATSAAIQCEFGRWDEARKLIIEVTKGKDVQAYPLYQVALLSLRTDDIGEYKTICQRLLNEFRGSDDAISLYYAAWTCSIVGGAVDDYAPAIKVARKAVEKVPTDAQYVTGLGAILMRSGKLAEAKAELEKATQLSASNKSSAAYVQYFLALTEHQLGNNDLAKNHFALANELSNTEFTTSTSWNRKQTLQLLQMLRQEATARRL